MVNAPCVQVPRKGELAGCGVIQLGGVLVVVANPATASNQDLAAIEQGGCVVGAVGVHIARETPGLCLNLRTTKQSSEAKTGIARSLSVTPFSNGCAATAEESPRNI